MCIVADTTKVLKIALTITRADDITKNCNALLIAIMMMMLMAFRSEMVDEN